MLRILDMKSGKPDTAYALTAIEMEIESAIQEGISVLKVIHGYGSHGVGGRILTSLRQQLKQWQQAGKVLQFYGGDKWNLFDRDTLAALQRDSSIAGDEDMNRANPGITIILLPWQNQK